MLADKKTHAAGGEKQACFSSNVAIDFTAVARQRIGPEVFVRSPL